MNNKTYRPYGFVNEKGLFSETSDEDFTIKKYTLFSLSKYLFFFAQRFASTGWRSIS
jgi:hypothetical protein